MIHWSEDRRFVEKEFIRMGFHKDSRWRISNINKNFELCNTYPRFLIIPSSFKDEDLESVAKFRYFRRIPTAVWRHIKNGCFIVRSSQPTVGWFGWFRSDLDESLVQSYVNNTMPPNSEPVNDDNDESVDSDDVLSYQNSERGVGTSGNKDDENDVDKTTQHTKNLPQQSLDQELKDQSNHNNNIRDEDTLVLGNGKTTTTTTETKTTIATTTTTTTNTASTSTPNTASSISPYNLEATCERGDSILESSDPDHKTTSHVQSKQDTSSTTLNGNGSNGTSIFDNIIPQGTESNTTSQTSKMLIIDARSYTAAMANRAKGGGCECSEYYQRCEVQFMNLANIHSIRKSFHSIRSVCEAYSEQSNNWVSFLDNSRWLHHISGLLKSALLIVDTIDVEEKSILIHCSDGWDRTPQLVALAEIMLDPHYRTFKGFRTLIQREWLDFGHKFADRCGSNPCNEDPNERCPVFLQWLDCVQQLLVQYPKHFEFNSLYLDKLNRHTYSNVFGTFSYNSTQERILSRVDERILSLWSYFDSSRRRFKNDKYVESDEILRPSFKVRDLHFWKEIYLPPIRNQAAPYMPITNNIDNKKFYDSLYIDGLTRTVCK